MDLVYSCCYFKTKVYQTFILIAYERIANAFSIAIELLQFLQKFNFDRIAETPTLLNYMIGLRLQPRYGCIYETVKSNAFLM